MSDEWRPVVGYKGLYEVNNTGEVRSLHYRGVQGKVQKLRPNTDKDGYTTYVLSSQGKALTKKAHRLVAKAFIGDYPEGKTYVNHKDGIKDNNRVDNLEWVSNEENMRHAGQMGLMPKGENHVNAKLIWEDVNEIKRLLPYRTQKELADWYGVSSANIGSIAQGRSWKHVPHY